MSDRTCVETPNAPPPIGPYCQANLAGAYLFTAATGGVDPKTGKLPPGGITPETEQALDNLQAILLAGGCDLGNVAKVTVFLADLADFGAMNEVYATRFQQPYPARSIIQTTLPEGKVAFDATALRPFAPAQPPEEYK